MEGKGGNQTGFTHGDISGIVQGAFGDKQVLQSSIPQIPAECQLGVRHSARHCWGRGDMQMCRRCFGPWGEETCKQIILSQ